VKADANQSYRLAEISDYVEMEDKSVPIGSPVGQNEIALTSEPIGDKKRSLGWPRR
jgi:hypothetical protein